MLKEALTTLLLLQNVLVFVTLRDVEDHEGNNTPRKG